MERICHSLRSAGTALTAIAVLLSLAAVRAGAQADRSASDLHAAAIKAYKLKDYATFLADEKRALALEPSNMRYIYNVAAGEALLGNSREAVHLLDRLLLMKVDLGAAKDDDFTRIHASSEWAAYEAGVAELRRPVVRSRVAFTLDDPNLIATGVAIDAHTGDTFVASVRERKIVRRSPNGVVSDFIRSGEDGFFAGNSLAVDGTRRILYATTSAVPFMIDYRGADSGRTAIFAFDLKSGRLLRKVFLQDGKGHLLNALTVDSRGNVYVCDSGESEIYVLRPGALALETFIPSGVLNAMQGLAVSGDHRNLYVSDWISGIWKIDLRSKVRMHLDTPNNVVLFGLDGLSKVPDGFIALQIGIEPQRVLHIILDKDGTAIAKVEILEMNRPDFAGPIQGTISRDSFYYVANSQLNRGNPNTGAFTTSGATPTIILALPWRR